MKEQLHLLKTSVQKSTEKAEKKAIEQKLLVSAFIFLFSTKLYYQSNEMISIYDLNLKMNFCKVMQDLVCYTNGLKLFISLSRNSKGKKKKSSIFWFNGGSLWYIHVEQNQNSLGSSVLLLAMLQPSRDHLDPYSFLTGRCCLKREWISLNPILIAFAVAGNSCVRHCAKIFWNLCTLFLYSASLAKWCSGVVYHADWFSNFNSHHYHHNPVESFVFAFLAFTNGQHVEWIRDLTWS